VAQPSRLFALWANHSKRNQRYDPQEGSQKRIPGEEMMTPWILIMFVAVYSGYVPYSIEFNSEQSCRAAMETLHKDKWKYLYCVPK
jgi:hypothetical protein